MTIVVYSAPEDEPLTVAQAFSYCHVDDVTTELATMQILIASARAYAEQELQRKIITQTLDAYFDEFPRYENNSYPCCFRLPPLQSVTSISYVDTNGVTQTLASNQYLVDSVSIPARIAPAYGTYWPSTLTQNNAVKVRFIAGYGDPEDVPACVKNWMLVRIKGAWDNRANLVIGQGFNLTQLPPSMFDSLLDPERVVGRL